MAWDTYVVIALLSAAMGFWFVKSLFPTCPKCKSKMKFTKAIDPQAEINPKEDNSTLSQAQFKDLRPNFFSTSAKKNRIIFQYECPSCGEFLQKQGK